MWIQAQVARGEPTRFFYLTLGYESLENYMRTIWAMVQHHKWGYDDIMNMIAWERQIFIMMTTMYLKEETERIKLEQQTRRR